MSGLPGTNGESLRASALERLANAESSMRQSPDKVDDLDLNLDLPALDGAGDEELANNITLDDPSFAHDLGDAFDDATGEDRPHDELAIDGVETGWLLDADVAGALDVGPFDVLIQPEGKVLEDEESDERPNALEDLIATEEVFVADGGEEGPLAEDEELREEDLPALDADDDGDVPDEQLFDRAALGDEDDLRWDDRAWARASGLSSSSEDAADDSGILAVPGEDATQSTRDAVWKRLEEGGRTMAAAFVPGDSVVLAVSTPDRSRALLVRVQPDGEARIIAEVDAHGTSGTSAKAEDDGETCTVTFLRWDAARGCLFVGGSFGVEAYRPS